MISSVSILIPGSKLPPYIPGKQNVSNNENYKILIFFVNLLNEEICPKARRKIKT
jgi:hypothetical protein